MQKAYQKSEHEIYLENEAGERIAEILFPEVEPKVYCIQRTFVDDSLRGQGCFGADGFLFVASFAGFISLGFCIFSRHLICPIRIHSAAVIFVMVLRSGL